MRSNLLILSSLVAVGATLQGCPSAPPAETPAAGSGAAAPAAPAAEGTAAAEASAPAAEPAAAPTPPPPPSGETCADAIPLEVASNAGARVFGSLAGKANDFEAMVPATGYSWTGADVFYSVNLDANDVLRIALHDGGTFDGGSWLFSNCADPAGSAIGGKDTTTGANFYEVQVPTAGTYFIAVEAYAGAMTGDYALVVHRTPENPGPVPTPADTCAAATPVALPISTFSTIDGGTNSFGEMVVQTGYAWDGVDQFWAFDMQAGQTLNINVDDNASFDSGWYVFRDCNNIAGSTIAGLDAVSSETVTTVAIPEAGRYYLAVDAYNGATSGGYTISVY